jgi:aspartyl-tRNA(Asn)/glutamyl-tRNA(Gln) amidotransferase subunit A
MAELWWLGAADLVREIARRRLSSVKVVEAHLARIEKLDGRLRSYLTVFADSAREAARRADAAVLRGEHLGALHGVPVAVKDLYAVAGTATTAGSTFLTEPAPEDSTVVARLRAAGAVILGKLNLHEFAYGPEGINLHYGTSWNPWDPEVHRMPGGSSSGSGVAVAAGLAPVGMGSDTGGSIRIPAACCGTVGLKPTYGRVSRAGIVPLAWSLDHAGPLTRQVRDAALVLGAIAGHDPGDPSTSTRPVPDYAGGLDAPVAGLRVGVVREYLDQADPEVRGAVTAAAGVLAGLGCRVDEVAIPRARHAVGASTAVLFPEATAYHEPLLRHHAAAYAPDVRQRLLAGRAVSATEYLKGQRARRLIRDEVDEVLRRVDCLLAPTLPIAAPPVTATELRVGDRTEAPRTLLTHFTRLFNVTGHPVVAGPCGFTVGGLPVSFQLAGRAFDEGTILRLAHAYEGATHWHARRPPGV